LIGCLLAGAGKLSREIETQSEEQSTYLAYDKRNRATWIMFIERTQP
jgi:hypothetical protein